MEKVTFANEFYKSCYILAMAVCSPSDGRWNARALTYWKRKGESHIGRLDGAEAFPTSSEAQEHARFLARRWCDEHMVDLIPSPVIRGPSARYPVEPSKT
jgi:hypothetical protein